MKEEYLWSVLLFLLALIVVFAVKALVELQIYRQFHREGQIGEAVVLAHRIGGTPRGGRAYRIRYRYFVQGQRYEREESVARKLAKTCTPGARIAIEYLPRHPSEARIDGTSHFPYATLLTIAFCLVLIAGIIAIGLFPSTR